VLFDRFRGVLSTTTGEGTHFLIPILQKPYLMDVRTRPRSISSVTGTKGTPCLYLSAASSFSIRSADGEYDCKSAVQAEQRTPSDHLPGRHYIQSSTASLKSVIAESGTGLGRESAPFDRNRNSQGHRCAVQRRAFNHQERTGLQRRNPISAFLDQHEALLLDPSELECPSPRI